MARKRKSKRRAPARARARTRARTRTGRRRRRRGRWPGLAGLGQPQLDLIGLALVGLGVFFSFVFYLGWEGGRIGEAVAVALRFLAGAVAYLTPLALLGCGTALVLKPFLPSLRPLKVGGMALLAALLLAFAAQTAGLGPDGVRRPGYFEQDFLSAHGGLLGEVLYWSASTLFQRLGAHILAVVLFASGVLLLTGTSVAAFATATGRALEGAGQRMRAGTQEFARLVQGRFERNPTDPLPTEALESSHQRALAQGHGLGAPAAATYDEDLDPSLEMEPPGEETPYVVRAGASEAGAAASEKTATRTPMGERRGVTQSEEIDYELPSPRLLRHGGPDQAPDTSGQALVSRRLIEALGHFGVEASVVGTVTGPHVSRFELRLAPGTKVSKVAQLKDDLAYALASTDIRILAPIPGKQAVGVEVPNQRRRIVSLGDIYQGRPKGASPLTAWLGKDIAGNAVWTDLSKMPHILVAGTTGSGKSGCVNAMLSSILLHASPNEARMVLVDPKQVELNHYEAIPHLLTPVVTAPRLAANVLGNLIGEMESRYGIMGEARCRSLVELNRSRAKAGEPPLPYVLCVIDELADLMMVAPAEVEDYVIRLAQKSRAVGIHLVLATQRPSTDVITGTIKVNIPARIAFAVASQTDSRVILDQGGAETLLGQGDMLFRPAGTSKMQRIQGAFVSEAEIAKLTSHWARQGEPEFEAELLEARQEPVAEGETEFSPDQDDLLEEAIALVAQTQTASVSMIQRRLRVGYTRAGRLIDMLERRGIISGYEGSKPRQVLIGAGDLPRVLAAPAQAEPALEPITSEH